MCCQSSYLELDSKWINPWTTRKNALQTNLNHVEWVCACVCSLFDLGFIAQLKMAIVGGVMQANERLRVTMKVHEMPNVNNRQICKLSNEKWKIDKTDAIELCLANAQMLEQTSTKTDKQKTTKIQSNNMCNIFTSPTLDGQRVITPLNIVRSTSNVTISKSTHTNIRTRWNQIANHICK